MDEKGAEGFAQGWLMSGQYSGTCSVGLKFKAKKESLCPQPEHSPECRFARALSTVYCCWRSLAPFMHPTQSDVN